MSSPSRHVSVQGWFSVLDLGQSDTPHSCPDAAMAARVRPRDGAAVGGSRKREHDAALLTHTFSFWKV